MPPIQKAILSSFVKYNNMRYTVGSQWDVDDLK